MLTRMLSFLPLSVPFGCFQPSFTFEGLAHVSPDRESVSAACACAHNARGQAEMGGRGCLQCRFQDYPRISMVVEPPSTNQDSRSAYSLLFGAFEVTFFFFFFYIFLLFLHFTRFRFRSEDFAKKLLDFLTLLTILFEFCIDRNG